MKSLTIEEYPDYEPEGFSKTILGGRYTLTSEETWPEACLRVARQNILAEAPDKMKLYEDKFFTILRKNLFVPGGRIWYNSGRNNPQLLNCFVLGHQLDSKEGWGNISREMIITSMTGGGCGIDFSDVRPEGAEIASQKGECPGPVSLMRLINGNGEPVKAGGSRRVALMFSLDLDHPDVNTFLDAKLKNGELTLANVSVRSKKTAEFIQAVKEDKPWKLSWKSKYHSEISARELWKKITTNAYNSAEPGFLNWELVEEQSPISYITDLVTTNPCAAKGTLVDTPRGQVPVECLKVGDLINTIGDPSPVTSIEVHDNVPVYKVTIFPKIELRVTAAHIFHSSPLQTNGIWSTETRLDQLSPGDFVAVCYPIVHNGEKVNLLLSREILSIEPDGEDTVYDIYEKTTDTWITSGVVNRGCGEICMSSYDSCCLGHLVLYRFVREDGSVDWPALADTIRLGVRFLDNTLTVNHYPLPEMKEVSNQLRRIGLGVTGLADMLILAGLKYGSPEAIAFVDKLMKFIAKQAYEASIMISIEKGMFPACKPEEHVKTGFVKNLPHKIRSLLIEHGIRNCAILTVAPTGTVSILSGNCSSGIEPIFAPGYERRFWVGDKRQTELVVHPLFKQFAEEGKDTSNFVSSRDLTVRQHMEMQKTVQRWIDNSVSKTINIPEDYSQEDMADIWLEYLPHLKGTTFYRENTRGYIDKEGNIHEPPLKALSTEEVRDRMIEAVIGSETDCVGGICEI